MVKVLQTALGLDMKAALALVRTQSKDVFRGSSSEAVWLVGLLEATGISPVVASQPNAEYFRLK
jgi:hypothetical protein